MKCAPKFRAVLCLVIVIAASCRSEPEAEPVEAQMDGRIHSTPTVRVEKATRELVGELRGGGYVIYFRHAATDTAIETAPIDLGDCSTQRNLSERGRRQSVQIGRAIKRLRLPVGKVLSSGYCRTLDTAVLAFGRAKATEALLSSPLDSSRSLRRLRGALRRLLSTAPKPSTNTVLISHAANIQEVARFTLAEGEAAVFIPRDRNRFKLAGRIKPEEWVVLAWMVGREEE